MTPNDSSLFSEAELRLRRVRKQRRTRLIILCCLVLVVLLTVVENRVFRLGSVPLPVSGNVLVFVLININVLLLLLMIFLVLRNLAELIFERRRKILGATLRTKLVISFVSMSLIPTGLLFFIALQFVSTSMDYWFNINVEQSLVTSLELAKGAYREVEKKLREDRDAVAAALFDRATGRLDRAQLGRRFPDLVGKQKLTSLALFLEQHEPLYAYVLPGVAGALPALPENELRRAFTTKGEVIVRQEFHGGELVRLLAPISGLLADDAVAVLVCGRLIAPTRLHQMAVISKGLEGYRQLMLLKNPIKTSLLVMLLIVTLLIIFAAIWFGFYVAGGLTGPIGKLAQATRKVAEGNLDFVLKRESGDEMGTLVESFNRMTKDLRAGRQAVEAASLALKESNLALEQRRRYTEIILQNVTAGVISLDQDGRITTINRYAEELLQIDREAILNRDYRTVLRATHFTMLEGFLTELAQSGKPAIQRHVRLTVGKGTFSLRVNFVRLEDEQAQPLGVVLVFDNLTELEKAQRMAAWREVARRIAHEVKNPLTPIQLSAQRLRKKYLATLEEGREVFDSCTQTIIDQVDELKRLVGEFSSFARMPAIQKKPDDLVALLREIMVLYQQAHPAIAFTFRQSGQMPVFAFDRAQLRRAVVNLLDNAVAVMPEGGEIQLSLACGSSLVLEISDTGPGVPQDDLLRLFEPYFSTKKSGTGLGLAIAGTIVAEHGGTIKVRNRTPVGACFTIELPV